MVASKLGVLYVPLIALSQMACSFSLLMLFAFFLPLIALGKECNNTLTQPSSHTLREHLLSSENHSIEIREALLDIALASHVQKPAELHYAVPDYYDSRNNNNNIPPARIRQVVEKDHDENQPVLQEISLHDVRLSPDSLYWKAQQTNLEYLLMLDVDSLVWSFRNTSGIASPGSPYGGWESPTSELRGHFVGHYMSAAALMWASTHNDTLYKNMEAVVDALFECQNTVGTGYLSAFPSEFFDRFEQIQPVWAPYYTIHKIMAGLLDQYTLAGNTKAFTMAVKMADYFNQRVLKVIQMHTIERHWLSLNEETGGMNDVLYRLYTLTDNLDHLRLAHLFDKPCFLGLLAVQADSLSGFHSNTHIPVVIGAQMRYQVTGDQLYKDMSTFFMDIVNSSHSYPTGGTSFGEFWQDPLRIGDSLFSTETEETCTTYNMLKVSRNLFRWTRQMKFADYYERALVNGILSIQRGQEPGSMIYMLPMGKGLSKAISYHGWGTKFESFWCCYGTGIESFSKLADSIYFEESGVNPVLYVVQLVSSSVTWHSMGLIVHQRVTQLFSSNNSLQAVLEFSSLNEDDNDTKHMQSNATIYVRTPIWTASSNGNISLNNVALPLVLVPGEYMRLTRVWEAGDKLELSFPVVIRAEKVKDDRDEYGSLYAFFFGPYLLAGLSTGDWDITGVQIENLLEWIKPVSDSQKEEVYSFAQQDPSTMMIHHLAHTGRSLRMHLSALEGTNEAVYSTFRLADPVTENLATDSYLNTLLLKMTACFTELKLSDEQTMAQKHLVGKFVAIEPFSLPGSFLTHGVDESINLVSGGILIHTMQSRRHHSRQPSAIDAVFRIVPGLSMEKNFVSFEAASQPGCFLSTDIGYSNLVNLSCKNLDDPDQRKASSFLVDKPTATYHPISFLAKGDNRHFLLSPLLSYRDENYTVFFNITL